MLTRRRLLTGAAGLTAAGAVGLALPGSRHALKQLLDPVPEPPHAVPSQAGTLVSGSLRSASMRSVTGFGIAYPQQVRTGLPFFLVLHGRGDNHRDVFGSHALGAYLTDAVRRGVPPFAVVGVDGGGHDYWHARASGEDPQTMILQDLLPQLSARGLKTDRFAVGGWSMGGYGALLLAERLGSARIAAVAVDSPALWQHAGDTAPGAFDDAADFAAHDVLRHTDRLAGIPVRMTCGKQDPFIGGVRAFLRAVPNAQRQLEPGGHTLAWWQHVAPGQLSFVGARLR